jgi:hypothetical protein
MAIPTKTDIFLVVSIEAIESTFVKGSGLYVHDVHNIVNGLYNMKFLFPST